MRLRNLLIVLCAFQFTCATHAADSFQNPIVSGFYPDPSICRVGDDYYLVNSSFEFFPGVPVFHSKDLVHWEQIGYCLTRKSQLNLNRARASGGIYAPTIRYHDGTFYMITTLVDSGGNFYVTAKDPAGPWSEPIWVDRPGIDPSLFFDDDGSVYYTRHEGMGDGYIAQAKIDIKTGKLEEPLKQIWRGTGDVWPEGPHLFKVHGKYFLVIAEGGTSYNHMVTVARSDSPWGPFTSNPGNPILTHRNQPDSPFQALGHSDLVETPAGWWLVFLGIRPQGGQFHHLGRETFLAPVSWSNDDWPVVNGGRPIALTMSSPKLPQHPWKKVEPRDEFDSAQLGLQWNYLRNPYEEDYSLSEKPGSLRLKGSAVTLDDKDSPAFVGRRQTDLTFHASTRLSFNPQRENEEAGLVLRGNEKNHYDVGVTLKDGKRQIFLRRTLNGKLEDPSVTKEIGAGDITLVIDGTPLEYRFSYQVADQSEKELGPTAMTRDLSSEKVGGFTGVFIGMYATGNKQKSTSPADFDWFEYKSGNP